MSITQNAKGESLLLALKIGFSMAGELGGAEKAVIFTESRRTQNYLVRLLSEKGYRDDIVLFNGSNTDNKSRQIYKEWKAKYEGTDRVTGSRSADTRAALVDYFREKAKIMIATEAAAEGINLQFCSLVVNYDLPWNPQRIEQRIGRCHRYGQKHDVVVVNFLNKNNAADQRVYQLLSEKFKLFSGVFGASDEVLGLIESGVDFEKRIVKIYQTCRTPEEIQASFDALQAELSTEINDNMRSTRRKLLENFDAEVAEKLSVYNIDVRASLNRYEAMLWEITQHILDGMAIFDEGALTFKLNKVPVHNVPTGVYTLERQDELYHHYRLHSPLAQWVLQQATTKDLPDAELVFQLSGSSRKITLLEPIKGKSGMLTARCMRVKAYEPEDYIIVSGITSDGKELDADQTRWLFNLPAQVKSCPQLHSKKLETVHDRMKNDLLSNISKRNAVFFEEEMEKLTRWAEDKRKSLKTILKDYDDQVTELKKKARSAPNVPEKLSIKMKIPTLRKKHKEAWIKYEEAAKKIDQQKDALIDGVKARLHQEIEEEALFTIQWKLV